MSRQDEIYISSTKEWMQEQKARLEEMLKTIEVSKRIQESNKQQAQLLCESTQIAIDGFNEWAKANGYELLDSLQIPGE